MQRCVVKRVGAVYGRSRSVIGKASSECLHPSFTHRSSSTLLSDHRYELTYTSRFFSTQSYCMFITMPDYLEILLDFFKVPIGSLLIQVQSFVYVWRPQSSLSFASCDADKLSEAHQYQMHNLGKLYSSVVHNGEPQCIVTRLIWFLKQFLFYDLIVVSTIIIVQNYYYCESCSVLLLLLYKP